MTPGIPVECRLCPGKVCVQMENGRIENTNKVGTPTGAIDLAKIRMVAEKIEDCTLKDVADWFALEGQTDETHLGC